MLAAYAFSGFAALVYEVTWTRLLTLRLGHTTAAASTVLAAFMGGLALGAWCGGRVMIRRSARDARLAYAALEALVLVLALLLPFFLAALTPLLASAYADGQGATAFAVARIAATMTVLMVPALALGATFPCVVKAVEGSTTSPASLYAVNTCGAALGAIAAGFVLVPRLGVAGATLVAVAASALSIALALIRGATPVTTVPSVAAGRTHRKARMIASVADASTDARSRVSLAVVWVVVALTGCATFIFEIGWTRLFALLVGPSTYAFSAVLAVCLASLAVGSLLGAALTRQSRVVAEALAVSLSLAAIAAVIGTRMAGDRIPRAIAQAVIEESRTYLEQLAAGTLSMTLVMAPVMGALGASFPLALALAARSKSGKGSPLGSVYAVNTAAAVLGALAAGFAILPAWGVEGALRIATAALACAALVAAAQLANRVVWRAGAAIVAIAALVGVSGRSAWNQPLLASGAYKYGRQVAHTGDLGEALTAGTLRYYRDGATSTVSVKELAGVRSMSIDGKVDASTGSDMLTQKLLAHVPLLLHNDPRTIAIIGLGSGVTLGAALVHPLTAADVVELSPEVVAASRFFDTENRHALADARTRLIVGDGRSHLLLSKRSYDVIVSEPSNPWMAGVASLFTQEFFEAARARLTPGGVLCQWAHIYDISADDLRSIVATFHAVFPEGTMWMVGEGDLLLIGSNQALTDKLAGMPARMMRPGVADDLASVDVHDVFALWSSFVGGGNELARYGGDAPLQTDSRMALEFTGPRAVNDPNSNNAPALLALQQEGRSTWHLTASLDAAPASAWRGRGAMLLRAGAAELAYDSYARALQSDASDTAAALSLIAAASQSGRVPQVRDLLTTLMQRHPNDAAPKVALAKLRASTGDLRGAVAIAADGCAGASAPAIACGQLASIYIDAGDGDALSAVVDQMRARFAADVETLYADAALHFMMGDMATARALGQRAAEVDSTRAANWNLLGAVAATEGDAAAARSAFTRAMALEPRDVTTYLNLARFEMAGGRFTDAARWFAEALAVDPESTAARQGLAQTRSR